MASKSEDNHTKTRSAHARTCMSTTMSARRPSLLFGAGAGAATGEAAAAAAVNTWSSSSKRSSSNGTAVAAVVVDAMLVGQPPIVGRRVRAMAPAAQRSCSVLVTPLIENIRSHVFLWSWVSERRSCTAGKRWGSAAVSSQRSVCHTVTRPSMTNKPECLSAACALQDVVKLLNGVNVDLRSPLRSEVSKRRSIQGLHRRSRLALIAGSLQTAPRWCQGTRRTHSCPGCPH